MVSFQAEDATKTHHWFKTLQSHALSLGGWRKRRNAMANIMISGIGIAAGINKQL